MSVLRRLEDVKFKTSWRRLIYDVLKTSDLWRLEDVCKTKSGWQRRKKLFFLIFYCLKYSEKSKFSSLGYYLGMEFYTNQETDLHMIGRQEIE